MVRRALAVLSCVLALSGSGCAVHEVHKDHDKIRSALLDLYTNQIMDNLVRVANGMPIIQVDYTRATGMVTVKETAGGSESQAATASNLLSLPAATLAATRTIVTTLNGSLTAENTNQVTVEAVPVTTSNEVYDAYLEFLDTTKHPGSLIATCDPPAPGAAHICQKSNGTYYWIPIEYRGLFLRLALLTTAQRGKGLNPPDEFFAVRVIGEVPGTREEGAIRGTTNLTLQLDRKLPADDQGTLVLDGDRTSFDLNRPQGAPPDVIKITVPNGQRPSMPSKLGLFENLRSAPQSGKVFLLHSRPAVPTTADLINRVNFQLQQIQNNQLR